MYYLYKIQGVMSCFDLLEITDLKDHLEATSNRNDIKWLVSIEPLDVFRDTCEIDK